MPLMDYPLNVQQMKNRYYGPKPEHLNKALESKAFLPRALPVFSVFLVALILVNRKFHTPRIFSL